MNKTTTTVIGIVLLLAIVLVAVGYAAIANITLNINGTAKAEAKQTNFSVKFVKPTGSEDKDTIIVGGQGKTTASVTDDTHATMDVTGLSAKGESATATFKIQNTSADLSALLSAKVTNSNEQYFKVTYNIAEPTTIIAAGTTTITVTVELLKTPVAEDAQTLTATIGVAVTAAPVQPAA